MAATGWVYVPQACPPAPTAGCTWCCTAASRTRRPSATSTCATPATTAGPTPTASSCCTRRPAHGGTQQLLGLVGLHGADYAQKSGPQMAAIKAMVDRRRAARAVEPAGADRRRHFGRHRQQHGDRGTASRRGRLQRLSRQHKVNARRSQHQLHRQRPAAATTYSWTVTAVEANGAESPPRRRHGTTTGSAATCFTASNYAHTTRAAPTQRRLHAMPRARTRTWACGTSSRRR